jgi:uncharacterized protein (TIRG00374 family)
VSLLVDAGHVGYVALPVTIALETLGMPVPGETALVAAAVLASQGKMDIAVVIALSTAAAIAGDNAGYLLGRRLGRRALLADGPFGRHRRGLLEAGDRFFAAHGAAAVFVGRWVVVGRVVTAWLAGADRMPWRRFLVWNALGGAAWASGVGLVAYALGSAGARWLAVVGAVAAVATFLRFAGAARLRGVLRGLSRVTPRQAVVVLGLGAVATGFVVFVLPDIAGAGAEWRRVRAGDPAWLAVAAGAEVLSYAGYVVLLHAVFDRAVGWRHSFLITMAGVAATRLLAAAGAGGIALTSWALHRLGLPARRVGLGLVTFLSTLYGVYMGALVVFGLGLGTGVLPGGRILALTVVPAGLAAAVVALALAMARAPDRMERQLVRLAARAGRLQRPLRRLAGVVADGGEGVRAAVVLACRRPATLLGALAWWGFDIAALGAAFHAFGSAPGLPVLVLAYFVGTLGNVLPLPGGVGGVEGGMIGAMVAFGEPAGPALLAVLGYRLVSFWLPTAIGAPAYVALRRSIGGRPTDGRP